MLDNVKRSVFDLTDSFFLSVQSEVDVLCCIFHFTHCILQLQNFWGFFFFLVVLVVAHSFSLSIDFILSLFSSFHIAVFLHFLVVLNSLKITISIFN